MSQLVDIIDELNTYLSGLTLSQTISFSDTIIPRKKVEQMGSTITGTLYPASHQRLRETRGPRTSIFGINLAITKKVTPGNDAEVQGMIDLVEEVADNLDDVVTTNSRLTEIAIEPIFDFDRLRESNVFTSLIVITARGR